MKYFITAYKQKLPYNRDLVNSLFNEFEPLIRPFRNRFLIDFINFWALISENAHSITLVGDISGMKNSVEVRSPFLNHKLVDLAFSIHPNLKIKKFFDKRGLYTKWILRRAFNVEEISEILHRPKVGFGFYVLQDSSLPKGIQLKKWAINTFRCIYDVDIKEISEVFETFAKLD